ncbi:hypothetical protein Pan241w_49720 [Gimesia alba]|uniref:Uncharacterized protein n=2 Tax=Gimesia alba TaxID=2527973 RepID=A0A517RLV0_9PLAN|nr:hypothetical protein Pan241w_49720 [Gimesia alba]
MSFVEIARPPLFSDALHFELADLDCREEAIKRILAYEKKHVIIRMIFPVAMGIILLVISGVLFHSLSITSEESDVS